MADLSEPTASKRNRAISRVLQRIGFAALAVAMIDGLMVANGQSVLLFGMESLGMSLWLIVVVLACAYLGGLSGKGLTSRLHSNEPPYLAVITACAALTFLVYVLEITAIPTAGGYLAGIAAHIPPLSSLDSLVKIVADCVVMMAGGACARAYLDKKLAEPLMSS